MIEGAAVAFSLAAHERMNSIWHGEPDRILEDHHGCGGMGVGTVSIQRIGLGGMAVPCRGASLILQKRGGAGAGAGGGTVRQSSMMR